MNNTRLEELMGEYQVNPTEELFVMCANEANNQSKRRSVEAHLLAVHTLNNFKREIGNV